MSGSILVSLTPLVDARVEGVVRPVRADLAPVSAVGRDLIAAAGESVEERLMKVGALPIGGAVVTPAGGLPCDLLIHVVVMSEDEAQTSATVQKALQNGLRRAADLGLASVALPPLGIGVGLTEPEDSARALVELLFNHLDEGLPPQELHISVSSTYELELFARLVEVGERDRTDG